MNHTPEYYYWKRRRKELGPPPSSRRSRSSDPNYKPSWQWYRAALSYPSCRYYQWSPPSTPPPSFQPDYPSSWNNSGDMVYYDPSTMRPVEPPRSAPNSPYQQRSPRFNHAQNLGFEGALPVAQSQRRDNYLAPQNSVYRPQNHYYPVEPSPQYRHSTNQIYPQPEYYTPTGMNYHSNSYNPPSQYHQPSGYYQHSQSPQPSSGYHVPPVMPGVQQPLPLSYNPCQQQAYNPDFKR